MFGFVVTATQVLRNVGANPLVCNLRRSTRTRAFTEMRASALERVALSPAVDVHIVPVLSDNFSYLILDKESDVATVVDPVNPKRLMEVADSLGARITTALVTHHHWDHAGGNEELAQLIPGVEIVGSAYEAAPAVTAKIEHEGSRTIVDGNLRYKGFHTPCHTSGHVCFVTETEIPALFCGDTLFVAGCGRFFEGSAADMEKSLNTTLAALSDDCKVFCGHEYSVSNLRFAVSVDGDNQHLRDKLRWAEEQVAVGKHTVPSTIGEEKLYNPFMRTRDSAIAAALQAPVDDPVAVMAALRKAKNDFRG